MLVTKVGGLAEIVPNGKVGYVVDTDTTQIADALVDFFENKRQDQFTQGIISEKKKYEWSGLTKSLMQAAKE
jgi:glycosyltransferase involved in cell wall biosynthesis